jgi:hypothetical protein
MGLGITVQKKTDKKKKKGCALSSANSCDNGTPGNKYQPLPMKFMQECSTIGD